MKKLVVTVLLLSGCISAQDFRATISGLVVDPSGAAIAGAKVKATQRSTNQVVEVASDHQGHYVLPYLMPDDYDIEVSATGFNKARREGVRLLVADKIDVPFRLEVGGVTDVVTVVAEAVDVVQTADASGGLSFDSIMTSEYALNGRQVYMLMDLTPGVLFTQEEFGATGYSGTRGWDVNGSYVMNGGKTGTNSFSLNGAPISLTGTWQVAPNMDAIQEFKVMTNTYDAGIGRTGGGSVNTTLKSGSNAIHGTLFDYIRNSVFDSNFTQNNRVGKPKGKHITNQFGGTAGGPLRKDRMFLFASFEGFRERLPFPVVADVVPVDLRDGQHFTQYGMTIYDPATGHTCVSKVDVSGNCSSTYVRNPFPGNVLPSSRINPAGQKILSYYPAPNLDGLTQNYVFSNNTGKYSYNQPMVRFDDAIDTNNRIYTVFTYQYGTEYRNQTFPGPAASGNLHTQRTNFNIIADWTRLLSPTAILDVRASFGRFTQNFPYAETDSGVTPATLGMTNMIHPSGGAGDNQAPRFAIDQWVNLFGNNSNLVQWFADSQWNVVPTVTIASGSRTWKFGVDLVYAAHATGDTGLPNGYIAFTRYGSQHYPLTTGTTSDGSGVADVLMGTPNSGYVDWNDTYYRSWPYAGIFVQNDWKVRRNLTLNLGLRYDVQFPFVERQNRVNSGFDYSAKNPYSDQIIANWVRIKTAYDATNPKVPFPAPPAVILGGKTFVGPGDSRRTYNTDWTNIQPRIGLAWLFAPKSVLRTGFGIYHRTATQWNLSDGFNQQTAYQRSTNGDITPASIGNNGGYTLQNPFPDGLVQPAGASLGLLTNVGNTLSVDERQRPIPRSYQYSFGLQRRLWWNVLLDASYIGSITVHDSMPTNIGYYPYSLVVAAKASTALADTTVTNPLYGVVPANRTLGTPTTAVRNLYRPFPEFNDITINTNPWARYRYDALQLRAEKRFLGNRSVGGALTMIFSYTFSKNFQTANYLNTWNYDHEKPVHELVSYDKPQNIAFSGVWDMPFGRGRRLATHSNRVVEGIIGGWTMNWVYKFNSGNPINGVNSIFNYGADGCASILADDQNHDRWFNNTKSCWKSNPSYTIRTVEDRYAWLRQMDNMSVNLAGSKMLNISERFKFSLRAEAFNLLNHPIYKAPPTSITDARFGMETVEQQNFPRNIQISAKLIF